MKQILYSNCDRADCGGWKHSRSGSQGFLDSNGFSLSLASSFFDARNG